MILSIFSRAYLPSISSLLRWLQVFSHLLFKLFLMLSSFWILDFITDNVFHKNFLPVCALSFLSLKQCLSQNINFWALMKFNLSIFKIDFALVYLKNYETWDHLDFLLYYFLEVLCLTFRSEMHFNFCERCEMHLEWLFCIWMSSCISTFYWKGCPFVEHWIAFSLWPKISLAMYMDLYLCSLSLTGNALSTNQVVKKWQLDNI
jgi:hypothetical protein